MISEYPYSKNDFIEKAEKYQKSSFYGIDFLTLYKQSRLNFLEKCESSSFSFSNFLKSFKPNFTSNLTNFKLEFYLESLLLKSQDKNYFITKQLDIIIKKFEIKKKLFTEYNSNFKEISKDYLYLRNYILLSTICIQYYGKTSSLKYLNTCLKINDILCSQFYNISEDEKPLFFYQIKKEYEYVIQLCHKKNIKIE